MAPERRQKVQIAYFVFIKYFFTASHLPQQTNRDGQKPRSKYPTFESKGL